MFKDNSQLTIPRKSHIEIGQIYFWTATVNQWIKLLEPDNFKNVIIDSSLLHRLDTKQGRGSALKFDGNIGGMPEYVIKDPAKIIIKRVSGVNPEF